MPLPLTIAVCVNDHAILDANLMTSPELAGPNAPAVIMAVNATSAADGLNAAIRRATTDFVVCAHQDVVFPDGALAALIQGWNAVATRDGRALAVAGVAGIDVTGGFAMNVASSRKIFREGSLPVEAATLDEIVLMVDPRHWLAGTLAFEPSLGWHLYGSDICLQVQTAGLRAEILNVSVVHNTTSDNGEVSVAYTISERALANRWPDRLPIRSTCSVIR